MKHTLKSTQANCLSLYESETVEDGISHTINVAISALVEHPDCDEIAIEYIGTVTYNGREEHIRAGEFAAEYCGLPLISKKEAHAKIADVRRARAKRKAAPLHAQYAARFSQCSSVALPTDLSQDEKRGFLRRFSAARAGRENLADLFAAGSLFCSVSADRTIHFQGGTCSPLGCVVLGITMGVVPENPDPEVLWWAVHAAARLLNGKLQPVRIWREHLYSVARGFGPGSKSRKSLEAFWGPGAIFEVLLVNGTFENLAAYLYQECARDLDIHIQRKNTLLVSSYGDDYTNRHLFW